MSVLSRAQRTLCIVIVSCFLLASTAGILPALGTHAGGTITVCDSGCDFASLQAALDHAVPGDVVEIGAGNHTEGATVATSDLTLRGVTTPMAALSALTIAADRTTVEGLLFEATEWGAMIQIVSAADVHIHDNVFRMAPDSTGIRPIGIATTDVATDGLIIERNAFTSLHAGVYVNQVGDLVVRDNTFTDLHESAITIQDEAVSVTVADNVATDAKALLFVWSDYYRGAPLDAVLAIGSNTLSQTERVFVVAGAGGDLQHAVDIAPTGGAVLLPEGLYTGATIISRDGLTVCSATTYHVGPSPTYTGCDGTAAATVIDGAADIYPVSIAADDVTVHGVTIENPAYTATGHVDPSLVVVNGDRFTLSSSILRAPAAPLPAGESRWNTIGLNIATGSDDVLVKDTTIRDIPPSGASDGTCAFDPCRSTGIFNWGGGTGFVVEQSEIAMIGGGCPSKDQLVAGECWATSETYGVLAENAGTVIRDSIITADTPGADGSIGGTDGIRGPLPDALIEGNTLRGWTGGAMVVWEDGLRVRANTIDTNTAGIMFCNGEDQRAEDNVIRMAGSGFLVTRCSAAEDGIVLRGNQFEASNLAAIEFRPSMTGYDLDARLNEWGVPSWQLIGERMSDLGDNNSVLYLPYLRDGVEEPSFPRVSQTSITPADCDAAPGAEFVGGHCRFFDLQTALDAADAGATVGLQGSADPVDPTPYLGAFTLGTAGLTLCGTTGATLCAGDAAPAHQQISDGTTFAAPPVLWSGEAVRIDTTVSPAHGSTSLFPVDGFQLDDLEETRFDWFLAGGTGCGGGSPRVAFWSDLDGDGTRSDPVETVLAYPDLSGCASGVWMIEDLLADSGVTWYSRDTGSADLAATHAALSARDAAYQIDSINVQYDTPGHEVFLDNVQVNGWLLGEEADLLCLGVEEAVCRGDLAAHAAVLDGSAAAAPAVLELAADDLRVDSVTVRHTGEPTTDVTGIQLSNVDGPTITASRVLMEGGGCTVQDVVEMTCFEPYPVTGIAGESIGATIAGNVIAADLASTAEGGMIGGTDGILGAHEAALIEGNQLRAWASNAVYLWGADATVASNNFRINSAGVLACGGADDLQVVRNEFLFHFEAIAFCGTPAAAGVVVSDNQIGLTNGLGLVLREGTQGAVIDAECNDWGVYNAQAVRLRVDDQNTPATSIVDTDPFTAPDGEGIDCLIAPTASFTMSEPEPLRGQAVILEDTSTSGSRILLREWDFGNGATSTNQRVEMTWYQPGTYDIILRVEDIYGMTSSLVRTLVVGNNAPDLPPIGDHIAHIGDTFTWSMQATDAEGDTPLTYSLSGAPSGFTLLDRGEGKATMSWSPVRGDEGTHTIGVSVSDRHGATTTQPLVIVVPVPDGPRFVNVPDVVVSAGGTSSGLVTAQDPDGDDVDLSVSGMPSWGQFTDHGDGTGQFDWAPPESAAGDVHMVTVTASSPAGTTTSEFKVTAFGYVSLALGPVDEVFVEASPGDSVLLQAVLRNDGNTEAEVALRSSDSEGWLQDAPGRVLVPAKGHVTVTLSVAPDAATRSIVRLDADAIGVVDRVVSTQWAVSVPVVPVVTFTEASAALGVRGMVEVRYLDGSPVEGASVQLTEQPGVTLPNMKSTATGVTNETGVVHFDFGESPSSRLPGEHSYKLVVSKDDAHHRSSGTFMVL